MFTIQRRAHPLLLTGLEMFSRDANNQLLERRDPLFWTELPEFSHLQSYTSSSSSSSSSTAKELPLKIQVKECLDRGDAAAVKGIVREGFLGFLAGLSGFGREEMGREMGRGVGAYGVDSLSAVGCQYWFWRGEFFSPSLSLFIPHPSHLSLFPWCTPHMLILSPIPFPFFSLYRLNLFVPFGPQHRECHPRCNISAM